MPFIAPFIPLIASAGASIGSSLLGSKLTQAKPTPTQQNVLNLDAQAQQQGLDTSKNLIGMGTQATQPVLNYWSSILSGNRGQVTSAMAPEISRIASGYKAATDTSTALMPRGGPRADILADMPYRQQRDVSTLLQTARPQAAAQLGGMGMSLLSGGVNSLIGSTSAGRDILTQQQQQQQLEATRGAAAGKGLFDMFTKYGMPALAKQWPTIFGTT